MVDGTEVLTLHSRFVVQNCCPAPARLRLVRKDGDAPLELSLAPRRRAGMSKTVADRATIPLPQLLQPVR